MVFKRSVQRYGRTPEPETPYQRAGQLWDDRIGSARVQARNWRLMAVGGLALTTAMSGAVIWQSLQSRVTPYIVEVDRLGEARAVTEAQAGYRPTDPQIAWHLARFIENVRSITLDPVLMQDGRQPQGRTRPPRATGVAGGHRAGGAGQPGRVRALAVIR